MQIVLQAQLIVKISRYQSTHAHIGMKKYLSVDPQLLCINKLKQNMLTVNTKTSKNCMLFTQSTKKRPT